MKLNRYSDYETLSRAAADIVGDYIRQKSNAVVCLASGSTPVRMFHYLVDDVRRGKLNVSDCVFVGLDEWEGVPASDHGACRNMMDRDFFGPLNISESNIIFFDGMASDPQDNVDQVNKKLKHLGGLDIMLVGVGLNGHIAMNEPGTSPDLYAHVGGLAKETIEVGQKYFSKPTKLSRGLTLGILNFREARLPILMANGEKKAQIIHRAVKGPPTIDVPASIVQSIPEALVLIDAEAGSLII